MGLWHVSRTISSLALSYIVVAVHGVVCNRSATTALLSIAWSTFFFLKDRATIMRILVPRMRTAQSCASANDQRALDAWCKNNTTVIKLDFSGCTELTSLPGSECHCFRCVYVCVCVCVCLLLCYIIRSCVCVCVCASVSDFRTNRDPVTVAARRRRAVDQPPRPEPEPLHQLEVPSLQ